MQARSPALVVRLLQGTRRKSLGHKVGYPGNDVPRWIHPDQTCVLRQKLSFMASPGKISRKHQPNPSPGLTTYLLPLKRQLARSRHHSSDAFFCKSKLIPPVTIANDRALRKDGASIECDGLRIANFARLDSVQEPIRPQVSIYTFYRRLFGYSETQFSSKSEIAGRCIRPGS